MKRLGHCWAALSLAGAFNFGAVDPDRFGGPTELQDTFLPAQLRYQSYPESARVIPEGAWNFKVEEDWTAHLARTETYLFDGESLTSTLKLRYSPRADWELGLDLPYTARFDGEADAFIEFVETTLNAKVPARYELPRDTYAATISTYGSVPYTLAEDSGLNDITLRVKRQVSRSENSFCDTALVVTLALPTGEARLRKLDRSRHRLAHPEASRQLAQLLRRWRRRVLCGR